MLHAAPVLLVYHLAKRIFHVVNNERSLMRTSGWGMKRDTGEVCRCDPSLRGSMGKLKESSRHYLGVQARQKGRFGLLITSNLEISLTSRRPAGRGHPLGSDGVHYQ